MTNYGSLEEAARCGQTHLEKLSFREAEEAFRYVLERDVTSPDVHIDRLRVSSLMGLAEIHVRRCRNLNDDAPEWLRRMLCAFALYKEALEIAESRSRPRRVPSRQAANDAYHFEEVLPRCANQVRLIEENMVAVMKQEISSNCMRPKPGMYLKRKVVFDDDWLQQLVRYCATGKRSKPTMRDGNEEGCYGGGEAGEFRSTEVEEEEKVTAASSYIPVFKRKIDYDRLQEGIRKIVSEVSTDVRSQYLHFTHHVPGSLMQKRLFHELTMRLSPGSKDNDNLLNVLEDSVRYEDCSEMAGEVEVESRRSRSDELHHRFGSVNRRDLTSELDSVEELDEGVEQEDEEEEDTEKYEDKDDDDDNDVEETIELCVAPSAIHSMDESRRNGTSGKNEDRRGIVSRTGTGSRNGTSVVRAFDVQRRPSVFGQSETMSRKQNSDTRNGNSATSEGGQSIGGLSSAFCTSGILTLWRTPRPNNNGGGGRKSETDPFRTKELHNFEEVSPLTERDKVLRWLQSVEPEKREAQADRDQVIPTTHPSGTSVAQAIGHVSLLVADALRVENRSPEAYEVYKFAIGIFQTHPLATRQTQMMADLLLRIGMTKCVMGQLATGSQLMEESAGMLERVAVENDAFKIAEVWFQIGGVYLAEKIRVESLQARVMQLIRDDVEDEEIQDDVTAMNSNDQGSEDSEQVDSYCVCIYEALACYKRSIAVLDTLPKNHNDSKVAELAIKVLSNIADCYIMTGNLDLAEVGYEEALKLFPAACGSPLLTLNAHVVSMLGTVSFLLRNFVRAATMYETSNILLQHLQSVESPSLEMAWTSTMLGLSYSSLQHHHKSVGWCIRAFNLYTRFFRGKILDVDPLCRWFIVQTLYVLGFTYITLDTNDKALYYLNLAKNMTTNSSGDPSDAHQLVQVLRAIADSYSALEEPDRALRYYEEALEQSKSLGDENTTTALRNQLLNRMAGANVDNRKYLEAGDNLEQALDYQKDVETSIKDDMIELLLRLGITSTIACDVDKAIGCYTDCIQAYRESRSRPEPRDVASVMASLGTLCHVKGCMQDDDDDVDAFMDRAEGYFEEAFQLVESASPVCVQYANFLYQQGRNADALSVMLPYVFGQRSETDEICYNGIEQGVLPDHLHYDADDEDTLVIEARVLAKFLAVLCYNQLGLVAEADDALAQLYQEVVQSTKAFNYVILGYGLMEMALFEEAAQSFMTAAWLQTNGCKQTYANACLCYLLFAYLTLSRAVDFILEYIHRRSKKHAYAPSFEQKMHYLHIRPTKDQSTVSTEAASASVPGKRHLYSPAGAPYGSVDVFARSPSPPDSPTYFRDAEYEREFPHDRFVPHDRRAVSDEDSDDVKVSSGGQGKVSEEERDREEDWEEWTTEEVIIETPREILELIANQVNRNLFVQGYQHPLAIWSDQNDHRPNNTSGYVAFPDTNELNRANSMSSDTVHRFQDDASTLDNAAFTEAESRRMKPEKEINGNKSEESSNEEWVITEEIIETPAEILALLRKTYCH